jgi:hypothetical protein
LDPAGLSLLTYPTLPRREYPRQWIKLIAKLGLAALRLDAQGWTQLSQGGHHGVTRSALAGCRALGLPHNLNPIRLSDVYPWVLVLSSVSALEQAIRLRLEGRIKHLWAGPNLVVLPTEAEGILDHPLVERVVVPSDWVAQQYMHLMPALQGRVVVWPAGVNLDKDWIQPIRVRRAQSGTVHVLHYLKLSAMRSGSRWFPIYEQLRVALDARSCQQSEVVYGSHRQQQYRHRLRQADVMLYWTDAGESQGLALLEAWAMDVPTFVVANTHASIKGVQTLVSAAPYLTPDCGNFFSSADELMSMLEPLLQGLPTFSYHPRRWVECNMTDLICMQNLVRFCHLA